MDPLDPIYPTPGEISKSSKQSMGCGGKVERSSTCGKFRHRTDNLLASGLEIGGCRYKNHEKSRKHKEKLALLKQLMEEEEEEEGGGGEAEADGVDVELSADASEGSAGEEGVEDGVSDDELLLTRDTGGKEGCGSHEGCGHSSECEGEPRSNGPCSNGQEAEDVEEGLNRLRVSAGDPSPDLSDQEDEVLLLPRQ